MPPTRHRRRHRTSDPIRKRPKKTKKIRHPVFYKILKDDLIHHDFQYQEGLNADIHPFDPDAQCSRGGLYFTDLKHIAGFMDFGTKIARVTLPPDALWVRESDDKWKANQIILSDIMPLKDWSEWSNPTFCQRAISSYPCLIHYVKHFTSELCITAIRKSGIALQYRKSSKPPNSARWL